MTLKFGRQHEDIRPWRVVAAGLLALAATAAWGQSFKHDNNNRLTEIVFPDGKVKRYSYDSAGNLLVVLTTTPGTGGQGKLPHTGITELQCYRAGSDTLANCASAEAIALSGDDKQDGMYTELNPMSYSRVGAYGLDECVKDNVTGLIWEGKTASGMRAGSNGYTNWGDGRSGDASEYVAAVNGTALCGHTDWRLPTLGELETLVDLGEHAPGPTIRQDWFVNMMINYYWSSSPFVGSGDLAWYVDFNTGYVLSNFFTYSFAVRLVHAGQ